MYVIGKIILMWVFENQDMGKLLELLVDAVVKVVAVRKCYVV